MPVLLDEIVDYFGGRSLKTFVDGTLGAGQPFTAQAQCPGQRLEPKPTNPSCAGGHSEAILAAHPELERLIGIDVDPSALQIAEARLTAHSQSLSRACALHFARANYSGVKACLSQAHEPALADGILLDLGVSSMQVHMGCDLLRLRQYPSPY